MVERIVDEVQEELLSVAEEAPEPGTYHIRDIIHGGDENYPATIVADSLQSAGWVFIYDTITHERSICNRNALWQSLRKTRDDGSRVFTTRKPAASPVRGDKKCWLHADSPNREVYDSMGLPVCKKSNLTSDYQVERHMKHRHNDEYAAIIRMQQAEEKSIEQDFRKALIEMARNNTTQ